MAEACLVLSKFVPSDQQELKEKLQQKSLRLARGTFERVVENGVVKLPVAFEDCEPILIELDEDFEPDNLTRVQYGMKGKRTSFDGSV